MNKQKNMTTIVVLSGKGGTGKTTVSNILIDKLESKVFLDCDVDAPNLHLVQNMSTHPIERGYVGLSKYKIDLNKCIGCGMCYSLCAYGAIQKIDNIYSIDTYRCEGCSLCYVKCPAKAIEEVKQVDGHTYIYKGKSKLFGTAQTNIGSGNSGKLVTEMRNQIQSEHRYSKFKVIDGPPGIGCPVIASMTNTNYALIVTEPSQSGLSDLKRIIETATLLKTTPLVIINKADLNIELSKSIQKYLEENGIVHLGNLPYDKNVIAKNNLDLYDKESFFFKKMDEIVYALLNIIKANKEKEKKNESSSCN